MHNRNLFCLALLAATLAGCATNANNPLAPPVVIPSINPATVSQIQSGVATACRFVPTAKTVADIVASFWGAAGAVDVVAAAISGICSAVTAKGAKRGGARYRGVKIEGRFIR